MIIELTNMISRNAAYKLLFRSQGYFKLKIYIFTLYNFINCAATNFDTRMNAEPDFYQSTVGQCCQLNAFLNTTIAE